MLTSSAPPFQLFSPSPPPHVRTLGIVVFVFFACSLIWYQPHFCVTGDDIQVGGSARWNWYLLPASIFPQQIWFSFSVLFFTFQCQRRLYGICCASSSLKLSLTRACDYKECRGEKTISGTFIYYLHCPGYYSMAVEDEPSR